MQSSNSFETMLWGIAGLVSVSMVIVLTLGWFKGVFWEQEYKTRKRHP
jgi:uncharacterized membrane protein